MNLLERTQQLYSLYIGQPDIHEGQVEELLSGRVDRLLPGGSRFRLLSFLLEYERQSSAGSLVVVDD